MSWKEELDELARRKRIAEQMGGPDKVKRQHDNQKLTVRERIDRLLDAGTFHEVGATAGATQYDADGKLVSYRPSNQVVGRGEIDGRPVAISGDDFTVRGGASDARILEKSIYPEKLARDLRVPLIRLVDGTGGGGSVKDLDKLGYTYVPRVPGWDVVTENLSLVPVVGLALGPVAGLGAARVAASHYALMVRGVSQIFTAGPPVVAHIGEQVTKEELGGADIHARNGTVDDEVASEDEAFVRTRRFLSYLPRNVFELPARTDPTDDPARRVEALLTVVPRDTRRVYAVRPIVEAVVDNGSFFEIGKMWGRSVVTGLARLDGWPVAVIASDPYHYGGAWTKTSCEKMTRLIDLAQVFHLPIVHLVDVPGFLIGVEAEQASTIRYGVRAMSAIEQSTVPWCTVIIRKCFGVAGAANRPHNRLSLRYAWPSGEWGSLPFAGGIEAAYKADIEASPDPAAARERILKKLNAVASPIRTAEPFSIEEIIDPRDTRALLCDFICLAADLRETGVSHFPMRP
jgi:acetyl-CoA carboxylase carboxyltransferase component